MVGLTDGKKRARLCCDILYTGMDKNKITGRKSANVIDYVNDSKNTSIDSLTKLAKESIEWKRSMKEF